MLTEICAYLKNYFLVDYLHLEDRIHYGTYTISNGYMQSLSFLQFGQYYRIVGSAFNDGVYQYTDPSRDSGPLTDEEFTGAIWAMSVPKEIIDLDTEITNWIASNAGALNSPYQSESFGGYSYSLKSGSGVGSGGFTSFGWQDQFSTRLAPYRRLSVL